MSNAPVIVFGPTGSVGSHAAITAQQHGAKVVLAMRDTSKAIPGLSAEEEKQKGFTRVTADLTKPETITAAVKETGAKRAFIYLAHQSGDHMKSTIEALKHAGIEFVVFLSSYTIHGEAASVPQHELIPFIHAQVEVQLENIFGAHGWAAVRPGAFATNTGAWWKEGIKRGEVKMYGEKVRFDWIAPEDMGGIAGVVLANGPKDGQKLVYAYGPQFTTQEEAFHTLIKELGKDVKLTHVSKDEWVQERKANGWPDVIANYLGRKLEEFTADPEKGRFVRYDEGADNVQRYLNRPGTSLKEWAAKNKAEFD